MNTERSYGIIPFHKTPGGGLQVLLIHQHGAAGDTFWTFPKGHIEEGESPLECALRELKEETDLVAEVDKTSLTYSQKYQFTSHEGKAVQKVVVYFVGYCEGTGVSIDPKELVAAEWLSTEAAAEKITYDSQRAIFIEALKSLDISHQNS